MNYILLNDGVSRIFLNDGASLVLLFGSPTVPATVEPFLIRAAR